METINIKYNIISYVTVRMQFERTFTSEHQWRGKRFYVYIHTDVFKSVCVSLLAYQCNTDPLYSSPSVKGHSLLFSLKNVTELLLHTCKHFKIPRCIGMTHYISCQILPLFSNNCKSLITCVKVIVGLNRGTHGKMNVESY